MVRIRIRFRNDMFVHVILHTFLVPDSRPSKFFFVLVVFECVDAFRYVDRIVINGKFLSFGSQSTATTFLKSETRSGVEF